jgi:hypothetical protein
MGSALFGDFTQPKILVLFADVSGQQIFSIFIGQAVLIEL